LNSITAYSSAAEGVFGNSIELVTFSMS